MPRSIALDLPFAYNATIRAKGARSNRTVLVRETAPFVVPSLTSDEAPVSTKWRFSQDARKASVTRVHEGRSYRALNRKDTQQALPVEELLADLSSQGVTWPRKAEDCDWSVTDFPNLPASAARGVHVVTMGPFTWTDQGTPLALDRFSTSRRIGDDRENRMMETADVYSSSLVLVEGKVWTTERGREPTWRVRVDKDRNEVTLLSGNMGMSPGTIPFRADRRSEAEAFARDLATRTGRGYRQDTSSIECNIDSLVTDDAVLLANYIARGIGHTMRDIGEMRWTAITAPEQPGVNEVARLVALQEHWEGIGSAGETFRLATRIVEAAEATPRSGLAQMLRLCPGIKDQVAYWNDVGRKERPDVAGPDEEEEQIIALAMGR